MNKQEFTQKLLNRAEQEGFEAAEVYSVSEQSFSSNVYKGELLSLNVSDAFGLGFRALIGGKVGYASTEIMDEAAIDLIIRSAKTNAELIENDDVCFIYEGGVEYPAVHSYNPEVDAVGESQKIQMAKDMESLALAADSRIESVEGSEIFSSSGEETLVNSKGLNLTHSVNMIGGYVGPIARDGDKANTGFDVFVVSDPSKIDLKSTVEKAVEEAVSGLYGEPVPSGKYKILLRRDAARSLLATFSGIFSAESAQKGLSLLKGREGESIASECVTLVDDPHMPDQPASRPFDGEGVPTSRKEIIAKGYLTTLLHNLKTAHKQGVQTTGNAARGSYASSIGIAPTNFYIQPGKGDMNALAETVQTGLMITSLTGLHAGANPISGDFSLGAKGYLIEDGKITRAVNQITVAGNFYALLQDVESVGDDLEMGMPGTSCFGSPSLIIRELSVAGN